MAPTVKKAEKEKPVTFIPGSKTVIAAAIVFCISMTMFFESVIYERKSRLKHYEKVYSVAVEKLEENNQTQE